MVSNFSVLYRLSYSLSELYSVIQAEKTLVLWLDDYPPGGLLIVEQKTTEAMESLVYQRKACLSSSGRIWLGSLKP